MLAQVLLAPGLARGDGGPAAAGKTNVGGSVGGSVEAEVAEHVALGHRLYQRGQYQEAIVEFRRAYELRDLPRFLYEIAESYRQLGATDQALFYYDRYLAGAPDAPDRDAIEDRVIELESLHIRFTPTATPATGMTLSPTVGGPVIGKPHATPTWRRWWFWTAVGVAIAAGATAAALATRSESSIPATDLGDKRFY